MRTVAVVVVLLPSWFPVRADDVPKFEGLTVPEWINIVRCREGNERLAPIAALAEFGPAAKEAVPSLIKLFGERERANCLSITAQGAVEALARIGPVALPALVKAMEDENPRIRSGAALTVGLIRPRPLHVVPALKKHLEERDELVRLSAAMSLRRLTGKPEDILPALITSLRALSPEIRQRALLELRELGPGAKPAIPGIIEALRDEFLDLNADALSWQFDRPTSAVINVITAIGPECAPELIKAATDRDPEYRASALLALACLPLTCKEVTPALRQGLQDRDATVRLVAAVNLWRRGEEAGPLVKVLQSVASEKDFRHSEVVERTLKEMGHEPVTAAALVRRLETEDDPARVQRLLRQMLPRSLPALLRGLNSDRVAIRIGVIEVLREADAYAAQIVPALHEAARDIDARVRFWALVGLARLDLEGPPEPIVTGLLAFAQSKNFPNRGYAISTIGYMKGRGKSALPALNQLANGPAGWVRDAAERAIVEIGGGVPDDVVRLLALMKVATPADYASQPLFLAKAFDSLTRMLDGNDAARNLAGRTLEQLVPHIPGALGVLVTALDRTRANDTHSAALEALQRLGPKAKAALPNLEASLNEGSRWQKLVAMAALDPQELRSLRRFLMESAYQEDVLDVLLRLGTRARAAFPEIGELALEAKNESYRALQVYLAIGGEKTRALDVLKIWLQSPNISTRREAISILRMLAETDPAAMPLLVAGLRDGDVFLPLDLSAPREFRYQIATDTQLRPLQLGQLGQLGQIGSSNSIRSDRSFRSGTHFGALGGQGATGGFGARVLPVAESAPVRKQAAEALTSLGPAARSAIPALRALLESENPIDRRLAATAIGAIGPRVRESVPQLRKALKDEERMVRLAAAEALSRLDQTNKEILPILVDGLVDERNAHHGDLPLPSISRALARLGKSAAPALIAALRDRKPVPFADDGSGLSSASAKRERAAQVAEILGQIGSDAVEAVPDLLELLLETDARFDTQDTRLNAAVALGQIGKAAKAASDPLWRIANDSQEDARLRLKCAEAVWRIDGRNVVPVLRELLHGNAVTLWEVSLPSILVAELGPERKALLPLLQGAMTRDGQNQRHLVLMLIGALGADAKPAVTAIRELIGKGSISQNTSVHIALWKIERKDGAKVAQALLDEYAAFGLQELQVPELLGLLGMEAKIGVPLLTSLLGHHDSETRIKAARSLWQITGDEKAVLPVLLRGLESGNHEVRRISCETLQEMGQKAKPALAELRELTEDPEPEVRAAAKSAVRVLDGK